MLRARQILDFAIHLFATKQGLQHCVIPFENVKREVLQSLFRDHGFHRGIRLFLAKELLCLILFGGKGGRALQGAGQLLHLLRHLSAAVCHVAEQDGAQSDRSDFLS